MTPYIALAREEYYCMFEVVKDLPANNFVLNYAIVASLLCLVGVIVVTFIPGDTRPLQIFAACSLAAPMGLYMQAFGVGPTWLNAGLFRFASPLVAVLFVEPMLALRRARLPGYTYARRLTLLIMRYVPFYVAGVCIVTDLLEWRQLLGWHGLVLLYYPAGIVLAWVLMLKQLEILPHPDDPR